MLVQRRYEQCQCDTTYDKTANETLTEESTAKTRNIHIYSNGTTPRKLCYITVACVTTLLGATDVVTSPKQSTYCLHTST